MYHNLSLLLLLLVLMINIPSSQRQSIFLGILCVIQSNIQQGLPSLKKKGKVALFYSNTQIHKTYFVTYFYFPKKLLAKHHNRVKMKAVAAQGFSFKTKSQNFSKQLQFIALFPLLFYKKLMLGLTFLEFSWKTQPCTLIRAKKSLLGHRHPQCYFGAYWWEMS